VKPVVNGTGAPLPEIRDADSAVDDFDGEQ
jgi:hypothetical protein